VGLVGSTDGGYVPSFDPEPETGTNEVFPFPAMISCWSAIALVPVHMAIDRKSRKKRLIRLGCCVDLNFMSPEDTVFLDSVLHRTDIHLLNGTIKKGGVHGNIARDSCRNC
jgi:hypothetical protein